MTVSTRRDGEVLVITADNPPVNALGHAVREGLVAGIREAEGDDAVKAVVIACAGRTFFAGADITEFTKPPMLPMLPEVVDLIEACPKPVVAAIHGTALGGGMEVALACHHRIAVPSAKLGLPEVKLGLLPGAGGTQRLPRVIGAEAALGLIVTGSPVGAKQALAAGLVDRLATEGALEADAIALAREVAASGSRPVSSERTDRIEGADPALFDRFRQENARKLKGLDAPEACIQAVEAAVSKPFAEGIALEKQLFFKLVMGVQSAAQRHIFFAERAAGKIDDVPADTPLIPIRKVGILGAGTMGGGIAMNFLSAGIPVTLVEMKQEALDRGVATITKNYEATAKKGRMKPEQVQQAIALITPTLSYDDLADCDLVIEAVFENMDVKKEVFARLDKVVKQGAILATNTSYLDVNEIATATGRPESVVGLHFFSPANVMKLLEVVRGDRTAPEVLATAMALAKTIRKIAVLARVCHGFIGNRMLEPRQLQAYALAAEGARPWDIDRVSTDYGFPMGAYQMADLAGVDIGWSRDTSVRESVRDALCIAGRWGQKTGKGFYDYDEKRNRTESAEVQAIIDEFAAKAGVERRTHDDRELLERQLFPLVNEGALILEEGIAQRASDIDLVWIAGYGWPIQTGGPMFWADTIGLDKVVAGLEKYRDRLGPDFRLSKLLVDKAAKGERFNR